MSVTRLVGIDFGTSTSAVRVKRYLDGVPVSDSISTANVTFDGSNPLVPTVIQYTPKGLYYGHAALVRKKDQQVFRCFKMDLENSDAAKRELAKRLTQEFFSFLYAEYAAQSEGGHLGEFGDEEKTLISYPVKWTEESKQFMLETARQAGFKHVQGMDEAQAAISAVTVQNEETLITKGLFSPGRPINILLIDMGAGTTDLVLCRYTPGENYENQILSAWPKTGSVLFGGREMDDILRQYVTGKVHEADLSKMDRITDEQVKYWKETIVSPSLAEDCPVDDFYTLNEAYIDYEALGLTRDVFSQCAKDYFNQFADLIVGCLEDAGMSGDNVDMVILTGGHSRWYFTEDLLLNSSRFNLPRIRRNPQRLIRISRPQETVALGLVYSPLAKTLMQQRTKEPAAGSAQSAQPPYGTQAQSAQPHYGTQTQSAQPHYGTQTQNAQPHYGTQTQNAQPHYGTQAQSAQPPYGTQAKNAQPPHGTQAQNAQPPYGTQAQSVQPPYGTQTQNAQPPYGTQAQSAQPPYGTQAKNAQPPYGTQAQSAQPPYGTQAKNAQPPYGTQAKNAQPPYGTQAKNAQPPRTYQKIDIRKLHTMPQKRADIINYYRRFMHKLIVFNAENDSLYAVRSDGTVFSEKDPRAAQWSNVASVAIVTSAVDKMQGSPIIVNRQGNNFLFTWDGKTVNIINSNNIVLLKSVSGGFVFLTNEGEVYHKPKDGAVSLLTAEAVDMTAFSGTIRVLKQDGKLYTIKTSLAHGVLKTFKNIAGQSTEDVCTDYNVRAFADEKENIFIKNGGVFSANGFDYNYDEKIVSAALLYALDRSFVFVTKDGKVGASDPRYDLSGWNDIAAVKAYSYSAGLTKHSKSIVGLKNDGTLIVRTFDVSFNPITGRPKAVRWTGDKNPDVRLF